MTPNRGMGRPPMRRFLSNYFDLLLLLFSYYYVDVVPQNAIVTATIAATVAAVVADRVAATCILTM